MDIWTNTGYEMGSHQKWSIYFLSNKLEKQRWRRGLCVHKNSFKYEEKSQEEHGYISIILNSCLSQLMHLLHSSFCTWLWLNNDISLFDGLLIKKNVFFHFSCFDGYNTGLTPTYTDQAQIWIWCTDALRDFVKWPNSFWFVF